MKIVDYKIETDNGLAALTNKVKSSMLDWWQPLGWLSEDPTHFAQALVKYEEIKIEAVESNDSKKDEQIAWLLEQIKTLNCLNNGLLKIVNNKKFTSWEQTIWNTDY